MSRLKAEVPSVRTSVEIKQLLGLAAAQERRSVTSMVEILVLERVRRYESQTEISQPLRRGEGALS